MAKLSLMNPLVTMRQLRSTPSSQSQISAELEEQLRQYGCELIQSSSYILKLPQRTLATAQVLLQRFYYVASIREYPLKMMVLGSIFLACKLEETPLGIDSILISTDFIIKAKRLTDEEKVQNLVLSPLVYMSQEFLKYKELMFKAEMALLINLGFNVHVKLPYALLINYLKVLSLTDDKLLFQRAWSHLNDGLRTSIYVAYDPATIACASIYLTARSFSVSLPNNPAWYKLFDASLSDIEVISNLLLRLSTRRSDRNLPVTSDELELYLTDKTTYDETIGQD